MTPARTGVRQPPGWNRAFAASPPRSVADPKRTFRPEGGQTSGHRGTAGGRSTALRDPRLVALRELPGHLLPVPNPASAPSPAAMIETGDGADPPAVGCSPHFDTGEVAHATTEDLVRERARRAGDAQ